ncbi:MAG TPA: hypothetical protein ENJ18_17895 [Nannocystis exedens]|nr:hypothetical protein [Nannocystis exedens]
MPGHMDPALARLSGPLFALLLAPLMGSVGCTPDEPYDLGEHPLDATVLDQSPVFEHLGASYEGGGSLNIGELLGNEELVFISAPDPRALLDRQAAEHAALLPIEEGVNLRVLTFNLALLDRWYPFTTVSMPEVDRRREHVPPLLLSEGWDVLCFQEVFDSLDVERIRLAAEDRGYRIYAGSSKHHEGHGLVIAVRAELIDDSAEEFTHEQIFEQQYDAEHFPGPGIARGFIDWSFVHAPTGRRLRVIDTHTTSFAKRWRMRSFQARELGIYMRSRPAEEVVILGGDFNAAPFYPDDVFGVEDGEPVGEWWANTVMYPVLLHYGGEAVFDVMAAAGSADDIDLLNALPEFDEVAWDREPYGDSTLCDSEKRSMSWDWCNSLGFDNYGGASEYAARIDYLFVLDRDDAVRVLEAGLRYIEPVPLGDLEIEISDHYAVGSTLRIRSVQ